ncbi:PHO85 cyclin-1 [Gnomoniopsis smithogilvyi]|uniref:PHO85 cyclin-1 n=1 Tax=Gnomoniopsis smithogilvyi TaxID=1191159 RepID=A0A9W8YV26_9PEZI|nr:PHO85 cyclin-1 [Gnomoniopsis smithogilvyi]
MASSNYLTPLSMAQLNATALEDFIYTPVRDDMISYLACAAREVIRCDEKMMPPPPAPAMATPSYQPYSSKQLPISPPRTPPPVAAGEKFLPSLEQFIRNLVWSSNVQVPTLMSTLVYLNRLKSRLQPEAKGLRCTAHRIFLAALILTAKYLNDSSPKNKHWAKYTQIWDDANGPRCIAPGCSQGSRCTRESHLRSPDFEFSKTEVNLMEKQLLMLLEWELRVTKEDLYRELDVFLAPLREKIIAEHERSMRRVERLARIEAEDAARREQERQLEELYASTYNAYTTPPHSPGRHSRNASRSSSASRSTRADSVPRLSSSHSYAPSLASNSSRGSGSTGATTPPSEMSEPYVYNGYVDSGLYDPPVEVIISQHQGKQPQHYAELPQVPHMIKQKSLLPYEISPEELREMETGAKRSRVRGMFGRIFNQGQSVRA